MADPVNIVDLDPCLLDSGGEGVFRADGSPAPKRKGVGVWLNCPCGCDRPLALMFANPIDGGPPLEGTTWKRTGETLETLTLTPSVQRLDPNGCRWHGFITNGQAITC